MDRKNEIGKRIKQRREELKMTQEALGKALWLNKSTIQRYETGKISRIKVAVIHAMASHLNVDPDWLMLDTDEMGQFTPRFDKYLQWEKENNSGQNGICIDYSIVDIRNKYHDMVNQYCQLCYSTPDEIEIYKKIIIGLEELNPKGLGKVEERIQELKYIPDCNKTGLTAEEMFGDYESNNDE